MSDIEAGSEPVMIERAELLIPGPAAGVAGLLGVPLPDFDSGAGLPLLWHWFYLLDRPAQADLGPDGHPTRGGVSAAPEPGRRRMWAGGRVRTHGPMQVGRPATRRSQVINSQDKHGRTGRLTFITVSHQIVQGDRLVVDEEQDIVYRDAATATSPPAVPDSPETSAALEPGEWEIDTSPTLLFRFSALTYNGHRIHYDRDYARDVEGYPGLVVHGPLQALMMAEAARRVPESGDLNFFEYRMLAPLFDHQGLIARADPAGSDPGVSTPQADITTPQAGITTTIRDRSGRRTATGTLRRR